MKTRGKGKSLFLLAITAVMLFAMSVAASAASTKDMGIKQTGGGSSSVNITWTAELGQVHYHVQYSTDNKTWYDCGGTTSSASKYIYNLSAAGTYYVRVLCYEGGYHSSTSEGALRCTSNSVAVKTQCEKPTNVVQKSATQNSVTLSWSPVAGAEYYNVYVYNSGYELVGTSKSASATVKGLSASSREYYYVTAVRTGAGNYKVESYKSDSKAMKTVPVKVSRIAMTYYWSSLNECKYEWTSADNADGYQVQVTKVKGKKTYLNKTTGSAYIYCKPYPKGVFTRARVRAYITIGTKKVYGPWSSYTYNGLTKSATAQRSRNGKQIKLKWKKVSGVSQYQIYISTKSDKGFKKVATLSSKKTSYVIKKYGKSSLKKNKRYYVRIKYVTKVGKKKITSGLMSQASVK